MQRFLVELFRPDGTAPEPGPGVRVLRSLFVPEDETVFLLVEADSEPVIPGGRVTEAVELPC